MSPPVLCIEGLTIGPLATETPALVSSLDLTIAPGETLCVVGESGSGKSLTALATMGLLPRGLCVRGGRIELMGQCLHAMAQKGLRKLRAQSMSMVFQEPMTALNPVVPVGRQIEEVLLNHRSMNKTDRETRIREMLLSVRLGDVDRIANSYPHQLSGGQRQRIIIAMALILDPQLLIADEPTTALDVTTQRQILSLIADLQRTRGTSVMFVTHDMGVVADIADRVLVMREGKAVETRPVEALLRHPEAPYTRQLLQSVPSHVPRFERPASPTGVVLQANAVSKTYERGGWFGRRQSLTALEEVGFSLSGQRTLGIVGESGSGKSTVARCVVRLVEPDAGQIMLKGHDVARLRGRALQPFRRRIQMIFQDPMRSLNPRREIGLSLIEGPLNFGVSKAEALAKARLTLKRVGLPEIAIHRYPHQFSGGQRQRIAIARALVMEPDVLVADEAVSALDVSVQAQVLELLVELQRDMGLAILFITHDLAVAAQLCDELVVMQAGRVVEYGTVREVLTDPKTPYTRTLIEASPGRHWNFSEFRPHAELDTDGNIGRHRDQQSGKHMVASGTVSSDISK